MEMKRLIPILLLALAVPGWSTPQIGDVTAASSITGAEIYPASRSDVAVGLRVTTDQILKAGLELKQVTTTATTGNVQTLNVTGTAKAPTATFTTANAQTLLVTGTGKIPTLTATTAQAQTSEVTGTAHAQVLNVTGNSTQATIESASVTVNGGAAFTSGADDGFTIANAQGSDVINIDGKIIGFNTDPEDLAGVSNAYGAFEGSLYSWNQRYYANNMLVNFTCYSDTDAHRALYKFQKSHSDVLGTKTATTVGDYIASLVFQGVDSAPGWNNAAYIQVIQTSAATASRTPSSMAFYTNDTAGDKQMIAIVEHDAVLLATDTAYSATYMVTVGAGEGGLIADSVDVYSTLASKNVKGEIKPSDEDTALSELQAVKLYSYDTTPRRPPEPILADFQLMTDDEVPVPIPGQFDTEAFDQVHSRWVERESYFTKLHQGPVADDPTTPTSWSGGDGKSISLYETNVALMKAVRALTRKVEAQDIRIKALEAAP